MNANSLRTLPLAGLVLALAACAGGVTRPAALDVDAGIDLHTHRDGDDLLTAGLGAAGLRSATPPAFANPDAPTAEELRRRAIWTNWRGIADLAPGGGYGEVYGRLAPVTGREYHALLRLPGRKQPHRVMVQVPDDFDHDARCIVVGASSGSRGIYGAIALAGAWGLPRGCAVAYTDKGAGTGYVDTSDGRGFALDGQLAGPGEPVEFSAPARPGADGIGPVAVKHAHSGDHPEADWGRHVAQAAQFAFQVLELAEPGDGPWTHANTRVIAVGVSNGGGAVLRAAGLPGTGIDAVVAISPNILPGEGGRALYDYSSDAALWMPCALADATYADAPFARVQGQPAPAALARCASLRAAGELSADDPAGQAAQARRHLLDGGWTDEAIATGALSTQFDLWRAVDATYASSYLRTGAADMPCGFSFGLLDAQGRPRRPTDAERAAWWSDGSGIPPGNGIALLGGTTAGADPLLEGNRCLRALWSSGELAAAVQATRAAPPRPGLPVLVVHGTEDGLVPEAFSGGAWARWAKAQGATARYWRVHAAQHFDAFLGLPALGSRYVPLMPYAYRALDLTWQHLAAGAPLPADADIHPTRRKLSSHGSLEPLAPHHLGTLP